MTDMWQTNIDLAFAAAAGLVALPMAWLAAGMQFLARSFTYLSSTRNKGSTYGNRR